MIKKSVKGLYRSRISIDYESKRISIKKLKEHKFAVLYLHLSITWAYLSMLIIFIYKIIQFLFYTHSIIPILSNHTNYLKEIMIGFSIPFMFFTFVFIQTLIIYNCDYYYSLLSKIYSTKINVYYQKFKNVKGNTIIISMFRNNILEFKTNGDYGKLLKKIDVRESKARRYNIIKKKFVPQHNLWDATFIFKKNLDDVNGDITIKWR